MRDQHERHDHAAMIADFRRRFCVPLGLTLPILLLSPLIQSFLGLTDRLAFPGDDYALLALSTALFCYAGWPFLTGFASELRAGAPGTMTLIALALSVVYGYSAAVFFGLEGKVFFWEHPDRDWHLDRQYHPLSAHPGHRCSAQAQPGADLGHTPEAGMAC